jgi:hypothetical protein
MMRLVGDNFEIATSKSGSRSETLHFTMSLLKISPLNVRIRIGSRCNGVPISVSGLKASPVGTLAWTSFMEALGICKLQFLIKKRFKKFSAVVFSSVFGH